MKCYRCSEKIKLYTMFKEKKFCKECIAVVVKMIGRKPSEFKKEKK